MPHTFCIAPMLDWTDRHERYFLRLLTSRAMLYTEMLTSAALTHGDSERLLAYSPEEHPVGVQLGGSDPEELALSARKAELAGYDEINLNIGCPSDRVQSGRFGACLMADPQLVGRCVSAMKAEVSIPVTVKCRIGIDEMDSDYELREFVETVAGYGCETFIVHARIALLQGLSPKENREIPPLNYERVFGLKRAFPSLRIIINGGIRSLAEGRDLLSRVDGVMVGREAYQNPWLLSRVDHDFFGAPEPAKTRQDILKAFLPYMQAEVERGTPLQHMARHTLGLFRGTAGGRNFRRHISENAFRKDSGIQVVEDALGYIS